jgi:excisionase family DNA binding protein
MVLLGCSRATVYNYMASGKLKFTKPGGSRLVTHKSLCELLGFDPLAQNQVEITVVKSVDPSGNKIITKKVIKKTPQLSLF